LRLHDTEELCAPRVFFGAAQVNRLMPDLDRWVIHTLLEQVRGRASDVRKARREFCINIAAQSLGSEGFNEFVVAEVCRSALPPSRLVFEFSESQALEHEDEVVDIAARLRDVGCRIALDYCAGVETLYAVRKFPISCIKIDGSLIRDVTASPRSEALVRAVVHLAQGAGIETVAECVESEAVREKLLDIGVDFAQGFHLSTPQPIERVLRS
jgi:Amt family ammonium transporter